MQVNRLRSSIEPFRAFSVGWVSWRGLFTALALTGSVLVVTASASVHRPLVSPPAKITPVKLAAAPKPPPPPGPKDLQHKLDKLATDYGETVGIAVSDVEQGWVAEVNGQDLFPQQSVSKTWVALTVLDAVDRGEIILDAPVLMGPEDRSVFSQPIARNIGPNGYLTTPSELLDRALIESDNAANDMLLKLVGGVEQVMRVLNEKQLEGLRLGADERNLQALIAGLEWRPEMARGSGFKDARARLAPYVRDAALDRYLADPADGATPVGIVQALNALKRGELLSEPASLLMLDTMAKSKTGPRRLRGGLPTGWTIAHKTGTGQDWRGASIGINDVALMTAPDGRTYSVAVLIKRTRKPVPARLEFMQQVSKAVVASWEADRKQRQAALTLDLTGHQPQADRLARRSLG